MKAQFIKGVCHLNGKPTTETGAWAALKAEYVKRLMANTEPHP